MGTMKPRMAIAIVLLTMCIGCYAADTDDEIWVQIEHKGYPEGGNYFVSGRIDPQVYKDLLMPDCSLRFVRLTQCRYYDADEEKYIAYSDAEDSGEVTIPTYLIIQIVRKKKDPLLFNEVEPANPNAL